MNSKKSVKYFDLGNGNQCLYVVERVGQQIPSRGDGICVKATICLPVDERDCLIPQIRFENRVCIANENLCGTWGTMDHLEGYHYRVHLETFLDSTWKDAFIKAEVWAENELQKLIDALEIRKQALLDAEK